MAYTIQFLPLIFLTKYNRTLVQVCNKLILCVSTVNIVSSLFLLAGTHDSFITNVTLNHRSDVKYYFKQTGKLQHLFNRFISCEYIVIHKHTLRLKYQNKKSLGLRFGECGELCYICQTFYSEI